MHVSLEDWIYGKRYMKEAHATAKYAYNGCIFEVVVAGAPPGGGGGCVTVPTRDIHISPTGPGGPQADITHPRLLNPLPGTQ